MKEIQIHSRSRQECSQVVAPMGCQEHRCLLWLLHWHNRGCQGHIVFNFSECDLNQYSHHWKEIRYTLFTNMRVVYVFIFCSLHFVCWMVCSEVGTIGELTAHVIIMLCDFALWKLAMLADCTWVTVSCEWCALRRLVWLIVFTDRCQHGLACMPQAGMPLKADHIQVDTNTHQIIPDTKLTGLFHSVFDV